MKARPGENNGVEQDPIYMPMSEARRIVHDPSHHLRSKENFLKMVMASHTICESTEATLEDLLACASCPFSSANWRPTHLLHDRMGVPKRFDVYGFIIRDVECWRDYLIQFSQRAPDDKNSKSPSEAK
jgi:hypothetical protein